MPKRTIIYIPISFINNQQVALLHTYVNNASLKEPGEIKQIIEPAIKNTFQLISKVSPQSILIVLVLFWRKIIPRPLFRDFEERERFIGKLINIITLNYFYADHYITVSNAMGGIFRGINPKARIFDYQHGIIPSTQPGFFTDGKITDRIKSNNKEVLVYGPGFKEVFMQVDAAYSQSRVHVIGSFEGNEQRKAFTGDNILVTLQIIETEQPSEWFAAQVALLYEQMRILNQSHWKNKVKVYLKPHPRSTGAYDLSQLLQFPFVESHKEEEKDYILHLTFYSTSAFDMAQWGIPTLFLYSDTLPEGKTIFIDEFGYPFPEPASVIAWLEYLKKQEDRALVKKTIKEWHRRFYAPFNQTLLTEILTPTSEIQ